MADFWKAGEDVHSIVRKLVANNHPDLALVLDEIVVVFRDKAGKSGGRVTLGTSRKVTPVFMLEIGADVWEHELDHTQQEALLDHLLCSCRCEEDEKTAEPKCSIAKPDIAAFRDNIERYGMWFPKDEGDENEKASPVEDLFGSDD
jgi:hypothetical protein